MLKSGKKKKTIGSKSICIWEGFPYFIFSCKHGINSAETWGSFTALHV